RRRLREIHGVSDNDERYFLITIGGWSTALSGSRIQRIMSPCAAMRRPAATYPTLALLSLRDSGFRFVSVDLGRRRKALAARRIAAALLGSTSRRLRRSG